MYDILSVFRFCIHTYQGPRCVSFLEWSWDCLRDGSGQHAKYLTLDVRRGEFRTVQRFLNTIIPWGSVYWVFFSTYLLDRESTYILAGDETVVSKSGSSTYGLSRFFSSRHGKTNQV